jgi:hypothetical protein
MIQSNLAATKCPICGEQVRMGYLPVTTADGFIDHRYTRTSHDTRISGDRLVCFRHVFRFTPKRFVLVPPGSILVLIHWTNARRAGGGRSN